MTRTLSLAVLFVVTAFAATAFYYPHLPDPMPVHFDLDGKPNGWASLPSGALVAPLFMVGISIALLFSHHRIAMQRGEGATRALDVVSLVTLAFVLEVHVLVLLFATGAHIDITRWVTASVGLLLAIIGNQFGKLQRNAFVGIRTTRTMTDDETLLMTHRFGGRVMVIGGLVTFIAAQSGAPTLALEFLIIATITLPIVYSFTFKPKGTP